MKKRILTLLLAFCFLLTACETPEELTKIIRDIQDEVSEVSTDIEEDIPEIVENNPEEPTIVVQHISGDRYAYSVLDAVTQQVYDEILTTIMDFEETIRVSTTDLEVLENAFNAVCADYGELYWIKGYSYKPYVYTNDPDTIVYIEFSPTYTMTEEEKDFLWDLVQDAMEVYLSECMEYETDYDKVKFLYEALIHNVEYNEESIENQTILSVFLYGQTVCQGYASALQYMCSCLDIPCCIIKGYANDEAHAWNLVFMDGAYYYIDVTWGNASYVTSSEEQYRYLNYSYFGCTTEELLRTHETNVSFELPECIATADNYYVREGLYVTSFDPEFVGDIIRNAWNAGDSSVAVKFSDSDLAGEMIDYLIQGQHITDYCYGMTSVRYVDDRTMCVLTFEF